MEFKIDVLSWHILCWLVITNMCKYNSLKFEKFTAKFNVRNCFALRMRHIYKKNRNLLDSLRTFYERKDRILSILSLLLVLSFRFYISIRLTQCCTFIYIPSNKIGSISCFITRSSRRNIQLRKNWIYY